MSKRNKKKQERCHKSVDNATKVPIDTYKSEEIAMKLKKNSTNHVSLFCVNVIQGDDTVRNQRSCQHLNTERLGFLFNFLGKFFVLFLS